MQNLDSLTTTTPGAGITAGAGAVLKDVSYIVETAANPPNTAIVSFQALLGDGSTWFTLPQGWVNTKSTIFQFGNLEALDTMLGIRPVLSAAVTNPILVSLHATVASDNVTGNWISYTATMSSSVGTITTQSSSSVYLVTGKLVIANFNVTISNIGTASGFGIVTLPVASSSQNASFAVREIVVNGNGYIGNTISGASSANFTNNTGGGLAWANNMKLAGTIVYQTP